MDKPLYKELAGRLIALDNCRKAGNTEWETRHAKVISGLCSKYGILIDLEESDPNRLVFHVTQAHYTTHGYDDGCTDHDVIVTPDLFFDLEIRITGRNKNDVKDGIYQEYDAVLRETVTDADILEIDPA